MTVWVECPNCGGKVEIPDAAPSDFTCPMCKCALMTSRLLERTRRLPSGSAPSWMRPWGYAFTIIGGLAFVAGAIGECFREPDPPMVAVIVAGLLNPIFFIGFPLGIYWLRRSKKSQLLAAIESGKPDSTVPCEEQEQPCTVNRTEDAMQADHKTVGWKTTGIVVCTLTSGIIAGIYFGGPSQGPGNASTSSAVARPAIASTSSAVARPAAQWTSIRDAAQAAGFQFGADVTDDRQALNFLLQRANNSVSDEEHRFVEAYRTAKRCEPGKENLQGIRSVCVEVDIEGTLTQDKNAFIETVRPDIELRLRQAGIQVVGPEADVCLLVQVNGFWAPDNGSCCWCTKTDVLEISQVIRHGRHYRLMSPIWNASGITQVGRSHFNGYTQAITSQITSLLNDYLAVDQP